jgi:hypothetical protein
MKKGMGREKEKMTAQTAIYAYTVNDDDQIFQILIVCCSRKYWTIHKLG